MGLRILAGWWRWCGSSGWRGGAGVQALVDRAWEGGWRRPRHTRSALPMQEQHMHVLRAHPPSWTPEARPAPWLLLLRMERHRTRAVVSPRITSRRATTTDALATQGTACAILHTRDGVASLGTTARCASISDTRARRCLTGQGVSTSRIDAPRGWGGKQGLRGCAGSRTRSCGTRSHPAGRPGSRERPCAGEEGGSGCRRKRRGGWSVVARAWLCRR